MTREEAKSELMQIYGSLSEEKKKALDVAFKTMEQADNIPVMYYPQVDGITPTVVAQADGEYIPKQAVLESIDKWYEDKADIEDLIVKITYIQGVAIPTDHDGCKDCRWQSQSETEMPCKQCMHNYTDEWERAKIGHWVETGRMFVEPNDDQILYEYICDSCKGLDYFRKSMGDLVGAKYCPCCNSPMEIER